MRRIALLAIMVVSMVGGAAKADWMGLTYGGHQPFWNPLHYFNNCGMNCEERKLQRFWHDYYNAQRRYYHNLSHLDWLTYYKNHGQVIGGGGGYPGCQGPGCQGQQAVQYAPVNVSPQMGWANPQGAGGYYPGPGMNPGMGAGMAPGMGGPGMMPASYAAPSSYPGYPGYGYPSMGGGVMPVGY